ncbi:MAG: hypothetical protein V4538_12610 [Bacteroidota bacterium]
MALGRKILKEILPPVLLKLVKPALEKKHYSFGDEEITIKKYLDMLPLSNKLCVDIAASDGVSISNTYFLYKSGWGGIAVELDPIKFSMLAEYYKTFENVNLLKVRVVPNNVVAILESCECPKDFAFLSLDIDSYDHFVLDQILSSYRPRLICIEINEKIPPPISFTVTYDDDHYWKGDHFYGQSISKCAELCEKHNYDIVELQYNNLFVIPKEINKNKALSAEEAYDAGYRSKADRKEKFPYNSDMEELLTMTKEDAIRAVNNKFEKYKGKYIIG